MKREHVRQGQAIEVAGLSIIPVERVVVDGGCTSLGLAVAVECTPLGVIFDDGDERWALGVDGESVDLEEFGVVD